MGYGGPTQFTAAANPIHSIIWPSNR